MLIDPETQKSIEDLLSNISVELIAGFIGFILGYFINRFWNYIRNRRPLQRFLGDFVAQTGAVNIYFGTHEIGRTGVAALDMLQKSHLSATLALAYTQNLFMSHRLTKRIITNTHSEMLDGDVSFVIVGFEHPLAQQLMEQPFTPITKVSKSFTLEKDSYKIKYIGDGFWSNVKDWSNEEASNGFILRFPFYKDTSKSILLIGGIGPQGAAAAGYFLWKNWKKIYNKVGKKAFVCRVSVDPGFSHSVVGDVRFLKEYTFANEVVSTTAINEDV
ncbi:MAG: hypothetical protein K8L99_28965 [Anaerolineae bacterium]|nr:hypothetical protein [Anaerolineae bacterium]